MGQRFDFVSPIDRRESVADQLRASFATDHGDARNFGIRQDHEGYFIVDGNDVEVLPLHRERSFAYAAEALRAMVQDDADERASRDEPKVDERRLLAATRFRIATETYGVDLIRASARMAEHIDHNSLPAPRDIRVIRDAIRDLDQALAVYGASGVPEADDPAMRCQTVGA